MIDDLVGRLNQLCRKCVMDEQNFTEGDEIRNVFKKIRDLGYTVYSEPFDSSVIVANSLSEFGKIKYEQMFLMRQKKMEKVEIKHFESAADFRDLERKFEKEVIYDYMKKEGVAYFKITDHANKVIGCWLYCEMLTRFFRITGVVIPSRKQ